MIIPVFKSGDKSSVSNYRPISLLCSVSKLLEKLIYDKVIDFVSASISPCQFGFRPKHSTTQQLLTFLHSLQASLSTSSQSDVIYLDFKKAFDSVSHNELLTKLWSFGLTGNLWKWFKAYLSFRSQQVILNSFLSDPLPVISGVPQGSILGPILFLIFVNDLPPSANFSKTFLFADDTKCLKKVSSPADSQLLQEDLHHLSHWCLKWNLRFNEKKCVVLRFCLKSPRILFNYSLNNISISSVNHHRDLGIIFSHDLKWNDHLKFISSRAYKILGLIRRSFSSGLPTSSKKNLYLSLVRSQLTYGSQIWRPNLLKDISTIECIQRRATKFILNDFNSDYRDRLLSLNILPLMMQLELYDILFFIRCLKNPDPSDAFSIHHFVQFSDSNTRSSSHCKLKHRLCKSNTESHLYFNRLPRLWNSLPPMNLDLSVSSIKAHLHTIFWSKFVSHFTSSNPCSFHFVCPCAKCTSMSIVSSYVSL